MRAICCVLLAWIAAGTVMAEKYVPAVYRQEISSTTLAGYKPGEYLVRSEISTGTPGKDAEIRHTVAVKVDAHGKPFTGTEAYNSNGKSYNETLTITLTAGDDPKALTADYNHTVREGGKLKLRFEGRTVLHHWSDDRKP